MKTIGIVVHSAEGGTACFLEACRDGSRRLGPYMHPEIIVSAIPMALSMPGWESGDHDAVAHHLARGVRQVASAGADFWVCPDNTAHIVLETIAGDLPIPGLHIADVVGREVARRGWRRVGLLGTKWTMTGPVYPAALRGGGVDLLVPEEARRAELNAAIFDELCNGVFRPETTDLFVRSIEDLAARGAECVVLGCTEIPLIITESNSPLPPLDSTRLLARYAVEAAIDPAPLAIRAGWIGRE